MGRAFPAPAPAPDRDAYLMNTLGKQTRQPLRPSCLVGGVTVDGAPRERHLAGAGAVKVHHVFVLRPSAEEPVHSVISTS